ncbi:MAG: hypothetical protein L3J24_10660 [Xanthomonadales bacterium]|nr:hypothetical protein [Xanthomonadales bacterium]
MKKIITYKVIILCLIAPNTFASASWSSLPDKISTSELIFKGVLIEKYYQTEPDYTQKHKSNKVDNTRQRIPQVFTVFVFAVDEVLKGEYQEATIEVSMLGGCDEEDAGDICVDYSFNYRYEINDNAVMFVNHRKNSNLYQSASAYSTAYTIKGSVEILTTEGSINYIYEKELDENGRPVKKDVLTLDILRQTIFDEHYEH